MIPILANRGPAVFCKLNITRQYFLEAKKERYGNNVFLHG
jgi:hypothetical protein